MIERHPIKSREVWLAMRSNDLTASDIGAAVGIDPYKSALQLYGEKTGQLMPSGDNKMMRRGRWLESAVIAAIEDEYPEWGPISRPKIYLRDPDLRLGATPDAVAGTDGELVNIQCKVVSKPAYERDWSEGPPLPYTLQTATEALLMGADRSMIAALVIDTYSAELVIHDVPRHAGAEGRVKEIARQFWDNVATGKRPAADYVKDRQTIAELHPVSVPLPVLDLSGDNRLAELLPAREMLKGEIAELTRQVEAFDTEIKAKLGDHERAELPGWRVSWKTQTRAERIMPASSFRVLRISEVVEQKEARDAA